MSRVRIRSILLLLPLLALLSACRSVGEHYRLTAGDTLPPDQHIVALKADLETGSTARGDLSITASELVFNAHVQGDLTIVASDLTLGAETIVDGDLTYCVVHGGSFQQDENAVIWGDTLNSCAPNAEARLQAARGERSANGWLRLGATAFFSLLVGVLAALMTILRPQQMNRITLAAYEHQLLTLGVGGLTLLTALGLSLLYLFSLVLVFTLMLAPLMIIGWLLLAMMTLIGVTAIAPPFGRRILSWLHVREPLPVLNATIGAGVLTFIILIFSASSTLWIISLLLGALIAVWALGAMLLTRAGTRAYPSRLQ